MRALFIALSLCIASLTLAQSKPPAPTPPQGKQGVVQTSPKQSSVLVEISPGQLSQLTTAIEANQSKERSLAEWVFLGIQAAAAVAVAVFTAVLACSTNKLWQETRRAARAAKKSADVAERSLLTIESARVQVNVPSTRGALMWGNHAGPNGTYNLTNLGRTDARIRDVRVKVIVVTGDRWPDRDTLELDVHDATPNLAPGQSSEGFYVSLGRELTSTEQQGLKAENGHRIYFVGRIQYEDVFRRLHTRWFCFKRFPVQDLPNQFSWAERGPEKYNQETIEEPTSAA